MASSQVKDFLETGNIRNSVNFPNAYLPYTDRHRVTAYHKNIPNMVGQITSILSQYHLNIADMVNRSRGDYAYTIIDIDNQFNGDLPILEGKIKEIPGIVTVRLI